MFMRLLRRRFSQKGRELEVEMLMKPTLDEGDPRRRIPVELLNITRVPKARQQPLPDWDALKFGENFTPHMV
jgi:hypothetical protein